MLVFVFLSEELPDLCFKSVELIIFAISYFLKSEIEETSIWAIDWKLEKIKNKIGANNPLNIHSKRNVFEKNAYVSTTPGKKKEIKYVKNTFVKVAEIPRIIGVNIPDVPMVRWNNPHINPIIVLKSAFNPRGAALTKSKRSPEKKPTVSPCKHPFWIEIYTVNSKSKSGTTGRK